MMHFLDSLNDKRLHRITKDGEEPEENNKLWALLGIQSVSGTSPSRARFTLKSLTSQSFNPSVYPSASPFRLSGKLWVPGKEESWFTYSGGITWGRAYSTFLSGIFTHEKTDPPPPPIKTQRDTPAIGFRAWTVEIKRRKNEESVELRGVAHHEPWPGRHAMTFRCTAKHQAPDSACGCGLYAYHQPEGAPEYMGRSWLSEPYQVMGAVVAWGKVIEYENGFRAQYARPIAMSVPPNPESPTQAFVNEALAEKAASLLGLPFVPYKNLAVYAREFGERLTA